MTTSSHILCCTFFFFFNDTATTEIYTLSLHDALPISDAAEHGGGCHIAMGCLFFVLSMRIGEVRHESNASACCILERKDRKSTRLNSSHANISYAVFCLKKKKTNEYSILKTTGTCNSV